MTAAVAITTAAIAIASSVRPHPALAQVDTKNANYAWSGSLTLSEKDQASITITYNSRTLYDGLFGFGWCSDLETRTVVRLDGGFSMARCGSGLETAFESVHPIRVVSADLAAVVARRGKGKEYEDFSGKKTLLDRPETVRTLLTEGVTPFALLELVGARAPTLGSGDYVANDGSVADFDGVRLRVKERNGTQWAFDAQGRLIESTDAAGNTLTVVARSAKELVFDRRGVRGTVRLGRHGKVEQVRVGGRVTAALQYLEIRGQRTLATIVEDSGRWSFEYDDLYNRTALRRNGRLLERVSYDQNRDWAMTVEDAVRGCLDTYGYLLEANEDVSSTLSTKARLQTFATPNDPTTLFFTTIRRKCADNPESLAVVQGFAYSNDDVGNYSLAATTSWAAGKGVSFMEYAPNGDLRAVTEPPVAVRSAVDRTAGTLTNSLFSVRYQEPENCPTDLAAEGVLFPPGLDRPVLFSARAERSTIADTCVITGVTWTTNAGQNRLTIERNEAGAALAVVLDGRYRLRRVPTGKARPPSGCSLANLGEASDERRIGEIVAKAIGEPCSTEQRVAYQIALVMASIQSRFTCRCAYLTPDDHTVADFGRWVLMDEFVVEAIESGGQQ
jgi:YD repeat-containing protein